MFPGGNRNFDRASTPNTGWRLGSNCSNQLYRQPLENTVGLNGGYLSRTATPIVPDLRNQEPLDFTGACKNLIVNYLPQTFTDKNLFDIFVPYGPIHSVKIMREESTGYSHGYGFVNFIKTEDAIEALKAIHGRRVEMNKYLKVSFARPPSEEIKNTNLYITNLPPTMTVAELGAIFGNFGPILQKNLLYDKITGTPRGTAFVRFVFRDDAARAVAHLNNFIPFGAWKPIHVKVAKDHGRQNAAHYRRALQTRGGIGGFGMSPQFCERRLWTGGPAF